MSTLKPKKQYRFYRGDYRKDADNAPNLKPRVKKGWFVGHFMSRGIRRTNKVEVKYWEYKGGRKTGHKPKTEETAIECTLILRGRVRGTIDVQPVELSEGKYFVVPPGVENNVPDFADEDCAGLTIKAPSIRGTSKKSH